MAGSPGRKRQRLRELFSKDSARRLEVIVDLEIAMCPFSNIVADAILFDRFSPRRSSFARVDIFISTGSFLAVSSRVPRMTVPPPSGFQRSDRIFPPVSGGFVVPSRSLVRRLGGTVVLVGFVTLDHLLVGLTFHLEVPLTLSGLVGRSKIPRLATCTILPRAV